MIIFTVHGTTIEVAKGGQSASARRPEIRNEAGEVIQSGASRDFQVIRELNAPIPQVQAMRWAMELPRIIPAVQYEWVQPAEAATDDEVDD